jgi:hypothetical protein
VIDKAENLWMAFSSASDSFSTSEKMDMETWLADRGLHAKDIAKLFGDVEKHGEAALTVSRLHEPPTHG